MEACGLREGKGSFPQGKTVRPDLGFLVQIYKRGPDWPVSGQVPSPSQSGGGAGVGPVSWVGQAALAQLFPQDCGGDWLTVGSESFHVPS